MEASSEERLNVLLVFADSALGKDFKKLIEESPLPVVSSSASSVAEALAMLSSAPFDAVLADCHLDGGLRDEKGRLRGGGASELAVRFPSAPCVSVGGSDDRELLETTLRAGAVDFIVHGEGAISDLVPYLFRLRRIRRKLTNELGLAAKRYENLVQALPDIVYELDPDGRFTFVNQSVSLLGYRPEELIGQHFSIILFSEDVAHVSREQVLPQFSSNRTGARNAPKLFDERRGVDRKTENLEIRLRRKDGTSQQDLIGSVISYGEIAAAGAYRYLGDLDEKVFVGTVGIIRDITLRRKSEDMLRRMYQAVDQSPVAILILDRELVVEYVNPAFFSLTSAGPDQALGHPIMDFMVESEGYQDLIESLRSGMDWKGELKTVRMGLDPFWSSATVSAIRSPAGAVTHYLCILEDVTQKRSLEDILRRARKDVEDTSRARSEFLAGMSADLITPLESIIATCEVLLADKPRPTQSERVVSVRSYATELLETLRDLMDLSRFEAGSVTPEAVKFELAEFADTELDRYRAAAEDKGLLFSVFIEPGAPPALRGDRSLIARIVGNLASNAVKFTEKGSVDLRFSVRTEGGSLALFCSVRDTGIGISRADQRLLFKPFSQVDRDLSRKVGGTGLGLAIAKELALGMGGDVWVESSPGAGSVFSFFVALESGEEGAPVLSDSQDFLRAWTSLRLLVAEDNPMVQDYLKFFLEKAGHSVQVVADGYALLETLERGDFDALILETAMPGLDGVKTAEAVRAYTGRAYDPRLPIVAVASYRTEEVEDARLRGVFDAIELKPLKAASLVKLLDELLQEKKGFDVERLRRSYAASPDEFKRLLMAAEQDLPPRIEAFSERIAAKDLDGAKAAIHGIVPVLSPIAALRALQLVKRFRKAVAAESEDTALSSAEAIIEECEAMRKQIRKVLNE